MELSDAEMGAARQQRAVSVNKGQIEAARAGQANVRVAQGWQGSVHLDRTDRGGHEHAGGRLHQQCHGSLEGAVE